MSDVQLDNSLFLLEDDGKEFFNLTPTVSELTTPARFELRKINYLRVTKWIKVYTTNKQIAYIDFIEADKSPLFYSKYYHKYLFLLLDFYSLTILCLEQHHNV